MRKTLIVSFVTLLSLLMVYGLANAVVDGPCADCHTMHGYQNGVVITWLKGTTEPDGPYGSLIKGTCLGCHTTSTTDPLDGGYPRVLSTNVTGFTDINCLAGGFFTDGDPDYTGKSHSIESTEPPIGNDYATYRAANYDATEGLTCAGTSGCHGDPRIADPSAAIAGGHHGTAVGGYRMLAAGTTVINVGGVRASDFEKALNAAPSLTDAHNVYQAGTGGNTISDFCATCHGIFHGQVGSAATAWTRHPTDVAIPTNWEIYTDFTNQWTNDPVAWKNHPLGFTNPSSPTAATAQVTCLSCHRAHGTENSDILRWPYADMLAGQSAGPPDLRVTYGCLGCHNLQR